MEEHDESDTDMTVHAQSELLKTQWLGSAGHLHSAASFLNDFEIIQCAKLLTMGEINVRVKKSLIALNSKDKTVKNKRETINDIASDMPNIYARNFIDLKASRGGFRSSQFTKVSSSVRSGVTPIVEKQGSWSKLKFWGKKKEESK